MNNDILGPTVPRRPPLPKQTVGLSTINKRLSELETKGSVRKTSRIKSVVQQSKEEEDDQELDNIYDEIRARLRNDVHGEITQRRFATVCQKITEYLIEYTPRIIELTGSMITGRVRMDLIVSLVCDIFEDVSVDLITSTIEHYDNLRLINERNEQGRSIGLVSESVHESHFPPPKKRKGFSRWLCGGAKPAH
eukprot:Lithocolla_globosa_v1_NODE_24_length_9285_cov_66.491832.p6 type:complete len:193 gc:universal NODE_24_length_9285_cov_66.491832:6877-7455(+)